MHSTTSTEVLQAALDYAAAGYAVFPVHSCIDGQCSCGNPSCSSPGKHPGTSSGFKDATTDVQVITDWFTRWPDANIGMATEGLLVVDLDPGAAAWMVESFSDVEFGGWQKTPRQGVHLVFDGGGHGCRCSSNKIAPKVDVRADGGYIVVAPSHINGNSYEWEKPLMPRDELPPAPEWLVEMVKGTSKPQVAAPSVNGKWHEGVRNDQLFSTACRFRNGGLGPAVIESSLLAVNEASCDPPLGPNEVARIAHSAASYSVPGHFADNGHHDGSPSATSNHRQIDYAPISAADLAGSDLNIDWLVDHLLAEGQSCILAGPKKTLKTSIALDLAIALASGTPFLGSFEVPRPRRVAFMSGESGLPVLQETLVRICRAKKLDAAELTNLLITEQLPRLGDRLHEAAMEAFIDQYELDVCMIDPAYLAMPGQDAGNLFINGDRLRMLNELTRRTGCTFVLLHHNRKSGDKSNKYGLPQLEDIAWAGFQEWARQWLLLNRRTEYVPGSGEHELWLAAGGSAGHGGAWGLDIEEGIRGTGTSRFWDVSVVSASDVSDAQDRNRQQKTEADMERMLAALSGYADGATKTRLREDCSMSGDRINRAIDLALQRERIVPCQVQRSNRNTPDNGYRLNDQA